MFGVAGDHCPKDLKSFFKDIEMDSRDRLEVMGNNEGKGGGDTDGENE